MSSLSIRLTEFIQLKRKLKKLEQMRVTIKAYGAPGLISTIDWDDHEFVNEFIRLCTCKLQAKVSTSFNNNTIDRIHPYHFYQYMHTSAAYLLSLILKLLPKVLKYSTCTVTS